MKRCVLKRCDFQKGVGGGSTPLSLFVQLHIAILSILSILSILAIHDYIII